MKRLGLMVGLCVAIASIGTAHSAALTIQPGPEGLDSGTHPSNANAGDLVTKAFGSHVAVDNMRVFFKFHLDGLPTATRESLASPEGRATLTLHQKWQFSAPHGMSARVHRVTEAWDEATMTGVMRTATEAWTTPLGTFDPAVYDEAAWTFGPDWSPITFDVTDLVRGWVAGAFANHGMILVPKTTKIVPPGSPTNNYGAIAFSDHPDPSIRPSLEISQVPVPGALPLALTAAAALGGLSRLSRRKERQA